MRQPHHPTQRDIGERWDVTTTTHEEDDKGESQEISLRTFTVKEQWGRGSNKEVEDKGGHSHTNRMKIGRTMPSSDVLRWWWHRAPWVG